MRKYQISDYVGTRCNYLVVLGQSKNSKLPNAFDFQCDCGNIFSDTPSRIFDGHRKTCGKCNILYSPKIKNSEERKSMIGKKYNMLTVVDFVQKPNSSKWYAKCICDCGNKKLSLPYQIKSGAVKSCGCLKIKQSKNFGSMQPLSKGNLKDGRSKHPLYGTWQQMIDRCENPQVNHYDRYGGRGIKVCDEWHDFWKFVEWSDSVGGRPKGYTIDRIDNDGNYCPENCRWADWGTQTRNKSSNIVVEYNGVSKTLIEWSIETGIEHQTLLNRFNRGWSSERMLTEKPRRNSHYSSRYKTICCYNSENKLIAKYENLSQIPKEFNRRCVSRCCCGGRKTHKGYIWRYEGD